VGIDSVVVEGGAGCGHDDQCEIRNGSDVTRIPGRDEVSALSHSHQRILQVETIRRDQATLLFRGPRWPAIRLRRPVGSRKDPSGQWIKTCTILTTTPNAVTTAVHDRMPVILDPGDYDVWLDPGMKDSAAVSQLLKPLDARLMRCYPVSNRVNQVQNDDAECSAQVRLEPAPQSRLFG
jgi:SOS response associated peptidase (SRAP)